MCLDKNFKGKGKGGKGKEKENEGEGMTKKAFLVCLIGKER